MELVLLIGLPAAGKSTFFRERFGDTHEHVSKDRMRHHRRPEQRQRQLVGEALARGRSVVVDNTNPRAADRAPLIEIGRAAAAEVVGYYFDADAGSCLRRNRAREGRARVPDVAIFAARKRLEPPGYEEGFDRLFVVSLSERDRSFEVRPQVR